MQELSSRILTQVFFDRQEHGTGWGDGGQRVEPLVHMFVVCWWLGPILEVVVQ